jgi:CMP-N,N'-diacetyllegionaminic acid synthase
VSAAPHVVAVIPARGGSTRIPLKNLAPLCGSPLVAHTILAALDARVDAVYVSTEDGRIAAVARAAGARVIDRPLHLAGDTTPTEPVLLHALGAIEAERGRVDVICLLQCTSPLRTSATIDAALVKMQETGCDSVLSVTRDPQLFWFGHLAGDRFSPGYDPRRRPRTQQIPPGYREDGSLYVMRRGLLVEQGVRMGGDLRAVVQSPLESVDIDTPDELRLAEALMRSARGRTASRRAGSRAA